MAKGPEHIEKYKRLKKKAEKIIHTTDIHHTGAYTTAADKVLRDKEGLVDYDLLKQAKYQTKFADAMSDYYIDKAEKTFKIKIKDRDEFEKALLMNAYAGVTKAHLRGYLRDNRENFTLDLFEKRLKPQFMRKIIESLEGVAGHHLKDEHIGDIVKYAGISDLVDTKYMRLEDALQLLNIHIDKGTVPEQDLEDKLYYKKKKAA